MSMQKELNKDLLLYVFKNEELSNTTESKLESKPKSKTKLRTELKKSVCGEDKSKHSSFSRSYTLLEDTNILINGKLNPELSDVYEIAKDPNLKESFDAFVSILINVLYDYQKLKLEFDSYLIKKDIIRKNCYSDDIYNYKVRKEKDKVKETFKEFLDFELVIKDLFDRFIYAKIQEKKEKEKQKKQKKQKQEIQETQEIQKKVPDANSSYNLTTDIPKLRQTTTEFAFRDILDRIFNKEPSVISEKEILNIVDMYYYGDTEDYCGEEEDKKRKRNTISKTKTTSEQKEMAAKSVIKSSIITVLEELEIITEKKSYTKPRYNSTHNREFKLIQFKSSSWKMNAKTKHDAISSLIGGISNITKVSKENKKLANFIIDFVG